MLSARICNTSTFEVASKSATKAFEAPALGGCEHVSDEGLRGIEHELLRICVHINLRVVSRSTPTEKEKNKKTTLLRRGFVRFV